MTADIPCSYATLSIQSVEIGARDIANALQLQIGTFREAGQPISARLPGKLAEHSTWQLSSSLKKNADGISEDELINKHVEYLVELLEEKHDTVDFLQAKCDLDIWCFISFEKSNHGFNLGYDLIRRLGRFQVNLRFDIYGAESELD